MLDIPMDPHRLMVATDSVGPVSSSFSYPVFPPFAPPAVLPSPACVCLSSLFKRHKDFPLACADHKHGVCRHAHVPNSHSLPAYEKERGREAYISPSPCGKGRRMRSRPGHLYNERAHVRACAKSRTIATCTHVRGLLPRFLGARLSKMPARWIDG